MGAGVCLYVCVTPAAGCCPLVARVEARGRTDARRPRPLHWLSGPGDGFEVSRAGGGGGGVLWGDRRAGIPAHSPFCPQHDGQPYCHKPCYGILFGPKGECGQGGWDPGAQLPTAPPHLATFLCRREHWSCGQLHLRQRPRGQSSTLGLQPLPGGHGPIRLLLAPAPEPTAWPHGGEQPAGPSSPARPALQVQGLSVMGEETPLGCLQTRPACPSPFLWVCLTLYPPRPLSSFVSSWL